MLIVFVDINGVIITAEWVPRGHTVNRRYYLQVLVTLLGVRTRKKRPELWENDSSISRQDNSYRFMCKEVTGGKSNSRTKKNPAIFTGSRSVRLSGPFRN